MDNVAFARVASRLSLALESLTGLFDQARMAL